MNHTGDGKSDTFSLIHKEKIESKARSIVESKDWIKMGTQYSFLLAKRRVCCKTVTTLLKLLQIMQDVATELSQHSAI